MLTMRKKLDTYKIEQVGALILRGVLHDNFVP